MMAEGNETPDGDPGTGPERPPRRPEGDLLAERRARRAAESGELALTRRAEAAEATVQTLERHVASLQQRLREAEDEHARIADLVEAEREATREREHELRRVKQREYAEQQLRVEAEERLSSIDQESRLEVEELSLRLSSSEQDARVLTRRLEVVQRQLVEADQAATAELAAVRSDLQSVAVRDLQPRLVDLERRALEIQDGLEAERAAREQSERLVQGMREGHRQMEAVLGEMKGIVGRASAVLAADRPDSGEREASPAPVQRAPDGEMADALAAAVERLRARAQAAPPSPDAEPRDADSEQAEVAAQRAPHKHSRSLIGRLRNRRKQRRAR
jgi:hypothetical protein